MGGHATTARLAKQNEKKAVLQNKKTKARLDRNVYIFCWKNTATVKKKKHELLFPND